jgi:hypothetical protein
MLFASFPRTGPGNGRHLQNGVETMTAAAFPTKTASSRTANRDQQHASMLVHYLGVEKALKVCKENTWTGVRQAIIEQQGSVTG